MANLDYDVGKQTNDALIAALKVERALHQKEVENIDRALAQLEKLSAVPRPERTAAGNIRHGETERAVLDYLVRVAAPMAAKRVEIMNALGTSSTTTYRALKTLEKAGAVEELEDGTWLPVSAPVPVVPRTVIKPGRIQVRAQSPETK
jgi:uncharacterized membrane protein